MKKFYVGVAALGLIAGIAWASTSPFTGEIEDRFKAIEATAAGGALADSKVLVGSSGGLATARTLSGDITNDNTGVTAIGAGKVLETMLKVQTADGLHAKRIARATWNCAASGCTVGAHGLGVSLPAKAMIVRSFIHVETQLADSGTCTHAFSCEDANNIKTATDLTGSAAEAFIEGASTGSAATMVSAIAATCEITFTVADGGSCVPSTGKGEVFVEYVVKN